MNAVFTAKLRWDLEANKQKTWVNLITRKYNYPKCIPPSPNSSFVFKGLFKDKNIFSLNVSHTVGNGQNINLWHDRWLHNSSLRSLIHDPLPHHNHCHNSVSTILWNLEALPFAIPHNISQKTLNIPLPLRPQYALDSIYWSLTTYGSFTLKSAYRSINNENISDMNHNWIWKSFGNMREKYFIWKAYNNGLPTTQSLHKRNITHTPLCPICYVKEETIIYILRECNYALTIWYVFNTHPNFYNLNLKD